MLVAIWKTLSNYFESVLYGILSRKHCSKWKMPEQHCIRQRHSHFQRKSIHCLLFFRNRSKSLIIATSQIWKHSLSPLPKCTQMIAIKATIQIVKWKMKRRRFTRNCWTEPKLSGQMLPNCTGTSSTVKMFVFSNSDVCQLLMFSLIFSHFFFVMKFKEKKEHLKVMYNFYFQESTLMFLSDFFSSSNCFSYHTT